MEKFNKKRYSISGYTKRHFYWFWTDSLKTALRIAKIPFWSIVKVGDWETDDGFAETIFFKNKES